MQTDVLGAPYEQQTIDLGRDDEGPVTATLVRRRAERPTSAAVLYIHGFVDYFFQTHLADFWCGHGYDFYAVDLRKYGRSLQPHQTPNFCQSLDEYYPELDEALRIITEEDGHDRLVVNGHSAGGLIAALWAHDRRSTGSIHAMFLNSPFFDINASWFLRTVGKPVLTRIGRTRPKAALKIGLNDVYGRSIHREHLGEWEYDLGWKPLAGFPVRLGWLRAVADGQRRLHAGLDIPAPVLVASSAVSYKRARWSDEAASADSILDVDHMARWAPALGRHVTLVRVEGGLHDLTLSAEPARKRTFEELERWLTAYG